MPMTMQRTRVRYDQFTLRGWTYPFHELRDQGKMAALVPETDEVRWLYLFGRKEPVEIRRGDVAIIYPQINWPLPPGMTAPTPAVEQAAEKLAAAAEKVDAFKAAAAAPSPPMSGADDLKVEREPEVIVEAEVVPEMSPLLLAYHRDGESVRDFVSRLTPELRSEEAAIVDLQLYGAGEAKLGEINETLTNARSSWVGSSKTVSERHGEISALLEELQRLGAEVEAGPDAC